ncbi:MAG: tRNA (adenosine(37)-N6)-threonylcarbamoyltransferase complex transferase subunit TsaD [Flavobacteriales bacterium]
MKKHPIILGIESSCDDTGASILQNGKVLSNIIADQKVHQSYGGVVPELASRAHQQNIVPVVNEAIKVANITEKDIDGIAFTKGPGLMGSLLVGTSFAKSFAMALDVPLIEVNHMQAHILAHFIEDANETKPEFPFICLTISGGHTQLVQVDDYFNFKILGETLDDAVGEAFDKIAKIVGLEYPGGPLIDQLAQKGNPKAFQFSKPQVKEYNFSFSGLKTSVLYFLQKEMNKNPNFIKNNLTDLCASVQCTIVEILMKKLQKVVQKTGINRIAIAGGVSANSEIRKQLYYMEKRGWKTYIPKFDYTTDNAAMIAMVGQLKYERGEFTSQETTAHARYKINEQ